MSRLVAVFALALTFVPMPAAPADPMQDGDYSHYSQRANRCYLLTVSGGEVARLQTFFERDCGGSPFADWPVERFNGGFTADNHNWYVHGWTADTIDVRFDTLSGKHFDFKKR